MEPRWYALERFGELHEFETEPQAIHFAEEVVRSARRNAVYVFASPILRFEPLTHAVIKITRG